MRLEQVKRVIFFWVLILVSVYAPQINAQRIKDLPKVNKYDVYTDSLRILFDRHDSTKTTESRYFKHGLYRWTKYADKFYPRLFNQSANPSTDTSITNHHTIDSMDIWLNGGIIKYWSKKDTSFVAFDSLKGTHIDPTGVYAKRVVTKTNASDTTIVNNLTVNGVLNVSSGAQVLGVNYTWKQASDPALTADSVYVYASQLWYDTDDLATYRRNATDTGWDLIIPGLWQAPAGSGLYLTDTHMGYYSSGSFKTYIQNNGYFYFNGDNNNYIKWLGDTLKIKGVIEVMNPQDFPKGATVYRQNSAPTNGDTVLVAGDIWLETDNGDAPHSWDGSSWIRTYTTISGGDIVTGTIAVNKLIVGTLTGYTLETAGNDTARVRINGSNNRIEWVNNSNTVIGSLYPSGTNVVTLTGNIANQDTITGGVIRTASSGARAILTGTGLQLYGDATNYVNLVGSASGSAASLNLYKNTYNFGNFFSDPTNQVSYLYLQPTNSSDNNSIQITANRSSLGGAFISIENNGVSSNVATEDWVSDQNYLIALPSHGNEAHTSTFLSGTVGIANGGTNATSFTTNQLLAYDGTSFVSTGFVKTELATDLDVSGNNIILYNYLGSTLATITAPYATTAGSVTNGVYTTGTYSNPSWLTQIAESKVHTGSGGNSIAYFDGSGNLALGSVSTGLSFSAGAISVTNPASFGTPGGTDVEVLKSGGGTLVLTPITITIGSSTHTFYMLSE